MDVPLKLVQISDTHLFDKSHKTLLGVNTHESLQKVLALIQQEEKSLDFLLHSGDLSQDHSATSYQILVKMLELLQVPTYYVPGNHDDVELIQTLTFPPFFQKSKCIVEANWQFILLNSQMLGKVPGKLATLELAFLQQCLETAQAKYTIIVLHHHPFALGSHWLDALGLTNAQEFWAIIAPYQVQAILFGHVHQVEERIFKQVPCYSVPSTCVQFKRGAYAFALENLPPGYRWLHLYPDGRIQTGIKRIASYVGTFDSQALGY